MREALYILLLYILYCGALPPKIEKEDLLSAQKILNITADIIKDTDRRVGLLLAEKKQASGCAAFEIGYLTYVVHEKYRRMVDKYNISHYMRSRLYLMELVMYLGEIERHYWEINHVLNMMHEIERKYNIESEINEDYVEATSSTPAYQPFPPDNDTRWTKRKKPKTKFRQKDFFKNMLTSTQRAKTVKNRWWPIDYGWEIDYEWWNTENGIIFTIVEAVEKIKSPGTCTSASNLHSKENKIINELSWGTKLKILKDYKIVPSRRVRISLLQMPEEKAIIVDEATDQSTTKSEDNSMKLKLFRLMYETVRDSDLKVRRAELIKAHYANYSAFEIGFIMGDITDKFNIMTDISLTLKRLYKEWRPMEHINAYEQIANKAIEVSHLIDIVRIINKKNPSIMPRRYLK